MTWVAVAVGVGTAGYQIYSGAHAKSKAKKEQARLNASRPKLPVSPQSEDAYKLAQSELSNGMSAESERAYNNAVDRQYSTSLDALLKGGGSINNVGDLFDSTERGRQSLAMTNENLRLQHVNNLVNAGNALTNNQQQSFQFNDWAPWADKTQANYQSQLMGQRTEDAGISSLGNTIASAAGGMSNFGGNNGFDQGGQGFGYTPAVNANNMKLLPTNYSTNFSPANRFGNNLPAAGSIRIAGQ